jgi:hypothetical protein
MLKLAIELRMTLPDIQLIHADRVFRLYMKILEGKAFYRGEESLTINKALQEALENIRYPYKSIEEKLDNILGILKGEV